MRYRALDDNGDFTIGNGHAYIDVSADERDRIGFAGMMNVGR